MGRARGRPHVLIATPVKNAEEYLDTYFALLGKLSYPADRLSLGFLESDSTDGTYTALERRLRDLRRRYRRVGLWKHDFGVAFPMDEGRWAVELQPARRSTTRSGSSGSTST
jgi:Anp1